MVKLPAGRTTISGQARQSRKTVPAARGAAFVCAKVGVEVMRLQASARMMFISVRRDIIPDHLSVLHDEPHAFELAQIGDGIAGNCDEIGEPARLDGPDL